MASTQAKAGTAASRTVRSRDGTTISYRTVGDGPAVIVIPSAMSTADDYGAFADALAETFTVHTIERRGRGRSGPQGDRYGIGKEHEDVAVLRRQTGARYLVGHSYGGLVALEAARNPARQPARTPGCLEAEAASSGWPRRSNGSPRCCRSRSRESSPSSITSGRTRKAARGRGGGQADFLR